MKGSCLCGAVAYEATPPSDGLHIGLCSCRSCRKAHAAPANVYASVPRKNFRWLRGEDKTSIYKSSPGKNRHFCSVCGSQLIAEHPGETNVLLRVALLDDDPGRAAGRAYLPRPAAGVVRLGRRRHCAL